MTLTVKSPKPARFPAYTIESEAGETLASVPIRASGDAGKLAAVMAASPELLAAADDLWGSAVPHSRVISGEVRYYEVDRSKMNALRAAIEKAKGAE
jgi:hypothetical protein